MALKLFHANQVADVIVTVEFFVNIISNVASQVALLSMDFTTELTDHRKPFVCL